MGHLFWRCLGPKWTSPKGSAWPCQACPLFRLKVHIEDADIFWLFRLGQLALFILGHHPRALASSSSHQYLQHWAWRGVLVHKSLYCWILLAVFSFVGNCCSFAESWAQLHLTIIAHAAGNHQILLKTNEFQLFYRRKSPGVWLL